MNDVQFLEKQMFGTLKTLFDGANARAEERLRDTYAIELIDQKIREAEASLKSAKLTLASLIQRERSEKRQAEGLDARIADLMSRAGEALAGGREDMATEAAGAIAELETERDHRQTAIDRIERQVLQLRQSVDAAHRRITDLKQGAVAARAAKREADMQRRLGVHVTNDDAFDEAEALIGRVLTRDDPVEEGLILREINQGLERADLAERMGAEGFGAPVKTTAADVLSRLKAAQTQDTQA